MTTIRYFMDEHRWLSNFHACPVTIRGVTYPSSENAYQAAKAQDPATRDMFVTMTAGEAKKAGQKIRKPVNWDNLRVRVMRIVLQAKFQNADLRQMLVDTGSATLEEGNWWRDKFWGIAYPSRETMIAGTAHGFGDNMLGILLMQVRDDINNESTDRSTEG